MSKDKHGKIRLHKFVKDYLKQIGNNDYTNPEIQKNIQQYGVLVDGQKVVNRLEWILPGQKISINWPQRSHGDFSKIKVLTEDKDFLVIYKPPGIVVQPGAGHQDHNLVSWLVDNYPQQKNFNPQTYPTLGLVHRLDKLTQGILLVAKNEATLNFFQDQFRSRKVKKKYLAVVNGLMTDNYHIKNYQARSIKNPTKNILIWDMQSAMEYDPKSRFAESYFKPLFICRALNKSIVEVDIKTGRMHQIRLQAQSINHSLIQDPKYQKINATIPKAKIFETDDFPVGLYKEPSKDVHNIPEQEFNELQHSIFGEVEFCLLSNFLELKKPNGEILTVKVFNN